MRDTNRKINREAPTPILDTPEVIVTTASQGAKLTAPLLPTLVTPIKGRAVNGSRGHPEPGPGCTTCMRAWPAAPSGSSPTASVGQTLIDTSSGTWPPPLHLPSCTKADLFTLFMFQIQHPSRSLATLLLEGLRLVKFLEGRDTGLFQTVLDSSVSEDLRLLTANLQTHLR